MKFIKQIPVFLGEVRQETRRITWPGRKEVLLTSLFVFIFTVFASTYFFIVDSVIFRVVKAIIGG